MAILVLPQAATPNPVTAYQGGQTDVVVTLASQTGSIVPGTFTAGSTLSAVIWEGQNQVGLVVPTVAWWTNGATQTGYDQWQVLLSVLPASIISLNPAGGYRLQISSAAGGITSVVADVQLNVVAAPGSVSPAPPDLTSYDFVEAYCSSLNLTPIQKANIPILTTAASIAIRRRCNRNFDLRTYVKKFDVTIYGVARLDQVPVQQILRVQGPQQLALTVSNNSQSVQYAQAYFAYTGQVDGYGANIQTPTGITLNWASNGMISNTTVAFTTNETISTLASAINGVGSGWQAIADPSAGGYGAWPVTELDGGYVGQGAALSALPAIGANFYVLSDLSNAVLDDQWRGFLNVGRQEGNFNATQWGPGGYELWDVPARTTPQQVKVTFVAGESTIPQEIQVQTAELVKWKLVLSKQEQLLASENAADYSYSLAQEMVMNMPKNVHQALATFILYYA